MSEKITFRELVKLIAEQSKQTQSSTNSFISELVNVIEGGLRETGSVSISGFGKFELRWMKERTGTHPQTGESITIPGQNKVYFKAFKALREDVNRPYAGMEAQILEDVETEAESTPETEKDSKPETKPAEPPAQKETEVAAEPDAPDEKKQKKEKTSSAGMEGPISLAPPDEPEEEDNGDHLLIERSVPVSTKEFETEDDDDDETDDDVTAEDEGAAADEDEDLIYSPDRSVEVIPESLFSVKEPTESEKAPKAIPVSTASSPQPEKTVKPVKEVKKSARFNWTYAAAAIIIVLAIVALFYFLRHTDETVSPQLTTQQQQEQVTEPVPSADMPAAADEETAADENVAGLPDEDAAADADTPADDEADTDTEPQVQQGTDSGGAESSFNTAPYIINRGESLWSISEIRMKNPYFWPVIYNLNSGLTNNPNLIPANAELSVPSVTDPENLTPEQLEEVARGYLSVYDWAAEHQPEYARYFLWAVGVFSADVLSGVQNRVDPGDWQFAISR
jgi:nucleoid DNA-binding protein/nucleoid-associated protein YgaU